MKFFINAPIAGESIGKARTWRTCDNAMPVFWLSRMEVATFPALSLPARHDEYTAEPGTAAIRAGDGCCLFTTHSFINKLIPAIGSSQDSFATAKRQYRQ